MRRLAATIVLLASGCVLPQPRTVVAEPSELDPIERLGRWDGETFVAVGRQTVPPGWGRAVLRDPRLRSWEARDRRGRPFEPWTRHMAEAITETDPHAVVLVYSWIDDAATSRFLLANRNALSYTDLHGRSLAAALSEATAPDFVERSGRVHLIGHSYGARVATLAAMSLPKAPRQLTLIDVPDAPMTAITGSRANLEELLPHLPIGAAPGRTFVDNYFSMYGERYSDAVPGVVDVALTPPFNAFAVRRRHLYGTWFYTESANHEFGMRWSPLIGGRPPAPGLC